VSKRNHKKISDWRFFLFAPLLLTPVANLMLRISPQIFEKIWNSSNGIIRGLGETDSWKNQKQKILWHYPFNALYRTSFLIVIWFAEVGKMTTFYLQRIPLPSPQHIDDLAYLFKKGRSRDECFCLLPSAFGKVEVEDKIFLYIESLKFHPSTPRS
jgi:hypothetical protein